VTRKVRNKKCFKRWIFWERIYL